MKKEIIINSTNEDTRIALLENGKLVEIFVERPDNERMVGDIYKGRIRRVVKGMQAAFINIGFEQDGFLHFSDMGDEVNQLFADIDEEAIEGKQKKKDVDPPDLLRNGQEINVQIIKEPIITKGPRVTTELTLPGRFMVLAPNQDRVGVSRKISSAQERKRLRALARKIRPKNFGIIIRTVAETKDETVLKQDLQKLLRTWRKVQAEMKKSQPPKLIFKDLGMASSVIRDLFTSDVQRVVVDSRKMYREIHRYLKDVGSDLLNRLEYFKSRKPVFDAFNIEEELQKSLQRKFWMKNGGYLIIEQTEALTSIDVNSGRYFGKRDHERNSLKINMEAAREITRQLRLRDIGGLIVIDFIDLEVEQNKVKLLNELKKELAHDRAVSRIAEMSKFGLVEMTRQRIRPSLIYNINEPCPMCEGAGLVPTQGTVLAGIERIIRRYVASDGDRRINIRAHPNLIEYLNNKRFSRRFRLMWKYWIKIGTVVDASLKHFEYRILVQKTGEDITEKFS
ncbi:MAG: Rne/Rng family ribonuclease [bacterium]|nr:MAG: Rne/Rng family ribonuclease [bacterium]